MKNDKTAMASPFVVPQGTRDFEAGDSLHVIRKNSPGGPRAPPRRRARSKSAIGTAGAQRATGTDGPLPRDRPWMR